MAETSSNNKSLVEATQKLFTDYSNNREKWAIQAQEDREFRLGQQWTKEQARALKERGQAPIVVNRIHPAVEMAKALLTANRPQFRVSPREGSDMKLAALVNALISYVWEVSDGVSALRSVVDDYYVSGMGVMMVYQDPMRDNNKGEVIIKDIDPLDVYIDPNSRDRFCDDAENIIVSRMFTKDQAKKLYPMYSSKIKNANTDRASDRPSTGREHDGKAIFPEDVETLTDSALGDSDEYVRGYERYYKEFVNRYRVHETFTGKEYVYDDNEFEDYASKPAWIIEGRPFVREEIASATIQKLQESYNQMIQQSQQQGGSPEQLPPPPSIERTTISRFIEQDLIKVVEIQACRICQIIVMGDQLLYKRILPTEKYPVVPFMNIHTRTPYPVSDVRMCKDMQEYINKTRSLIIAHATTSTNVKILVPAGSVDMKEFEQKWAQPGVAIEVDFDQGAPQPVQPLPLPNELYQNEQTAKSDIDHQLGLYELMMGNSQAAPHTFKATVSIDDFGQRKIKSKLMDIEAGLSRVCQVAIPLMQQLYQEEKMFRLVQPNNTTSEFLVNKRFYDDYTETFQKHNDINLGTYDVVVVTGTTLPTNRYAQLELYMDAYKNGIIDKMEVLKKTEIFDVEGVLKRTDTIEQLTAQLEQANEMIKSLEGDMQSRDRENVNLKQRVEVEKFKADLDKVSNRAQAAGTIYEKRLDDATSEMASEVRKTTKESGKTKDTSKAS
tara:strand:+ start:3532 stop:5703 length:2172 start_codon:yes stop_codon:yes gene_type:complete